MLDSLSSDSTTSPPFPQRARRATESFVLVWPWILVSLGLAGLPLAAIGHASVGVFFVGLVSLLITSAALCHPDRDALSTLLTTWTGRVFLALLTIGAIWWLRSEEPLVALFGTVAKSDAGLAHLMPFVLALSGIVAVQHKTSRRMVLIGFYAAAIVTFLLFLTGFLVLLPVDTGSDAFHILAWYGPAGLALTYGFFLLLLIGLWSIRGASPVLPALLAFLAIGQVILLFFPGNPVARAFLWLGAGMALGSLPAPALDRHSGFCRYLLRIAVVCCFLLTMVNVVWLFTLFADTGS